MENLTNLNKQGYKEIYENNEGQPYRIVTYPINANDLDNILGTSKLISVVPLASSEHVKVDECGFICSGLSMAFEENNGEHFEITISLTENETYKGMIIHKTCNEYI